MNSLRGRLLTARLMSAGVGRGAEGAENIARGAKTIVLEDITQLRNALMSDLVTSRTCVFAPGRHDNPQVVAYEGSFGEPGAEFALQESFYLQIQSYGVSEYMSVVGPTLVRVTDTSDFAAYLADANRAVREGVFARFLTNPVIQLADIPALGSGATGDGPGLRLYVRSSGVISTSPYGEALGTIDDGWCGVVGRWEAANATSTAPCAVSLAMAIEEGERSHGLNENPWLGRYLLAVEAVRDVQARGVQNPRVSGFGHRLNPELPLADDIADATDLMAPVVLWSGEVAFVYHPGTGRTFRVSMPVARTVEALAARGGAMAAAEHASRAYVAKVAEMLAARGIVLTGETIVS